MRFINSGSHHYLPHDCLQIFIVSLLALISFSFQSKERKVVKIQADDPISFMQLINKNAFGAGENVFELTLSQALGHTGKKESDPMAASKLNKVLLSDCITRSIWSSMAVVNLENRIGF